MRARQALLESQLSNPRYETGGTEPSYNVWEWDLRRRLDMKQVMRLKVRIECHVEMTAQISL